MFRNYWKIGLRNLFKNRLFSLINIGGMAISIACFLIIGLFIHDEWSFDKHIRDVDRKYRVYSELFSDDGTMRKASMIPPMVAPTLMAEYPEVESYARFLYFNTTVLFEAGDRKYAEGNGGYADATIFDMFSMKLKEGDAGTALRAPNTVAISRTLAEKYFPGKPALGETIKIAGEPQRIDAVFEDFPSHAHFRMNFFLAMESVVQQSPALLQRWGWNQFHTYIKLKPGTDAAQLEGKLKGFAERNAWPQTKPGGSYAIFHLMRLDRVHLEAYDQQWDVAVRGNKQTVYILLATAVFILVVAILNFVNLSTARALSRVKEVGVRKVVGALRTQLIGQFISESMIIAMIALVIGGLITELVLPLLNTFTEKNIPTTVFLEPLTLLIIILFAIAVGLAAGAYPALYISGYKPAQILSNKSSGRSGKILLRQGLVVIQFILSFLLISASLIVSEQHRFLRTKNMGFDKDNLIVMPLRGDMEVKPEEAKQAFMNNTNVLGGTLGYGLPGQAFAGDGIKDKITGKQWPISMLTVDEDYAKTLDLTLIAGRDFSKDIPSDSSDAFILSEAATRMLGYQRPADALNHPLEWTRWDNPNKLKEGKVIGIVKDFHLNSLRENITPVVLHVYPFAFNTLTLRVRPDHLPETIAFLGKTWKKFNADWPFEYKFLDENFDKLYKSEEKLATLFAFFTGFTIFVACLGLFGLVVYSTSQRFREISIRKVMGAEESSLVIHLGKSYVLLIAIAFVVAVPFSYYMASSWLSEFAYHITLTPMVFVKSGAAILFIAGLTIGIQSLKAARTNPVEALKEQ